MAREHLGLSVSRARSSLAAILGVALLAGCGASSPTASPAAVATSTAPSASPSAASPSPSAASPSPAESSPSPSESAAASGVATSIDPCQLVTKDEASKLAGGSFGVGKETTNPGGGKTCVYGGQTQNVFTVIVAQATDAASAQADWTQEQAKAQAALQKAVPPGVTLNLKVNDLSNVAGADKAAIATLKESISGISVEVTAIYLLKGPIFLTFSDLAVGHAAPSTADMESQAQTSLGRLP